MPARTDDSPLDPLRRRAPLAHHFKRGLPIDRYYIDRFLERHRDDIRGDVLEIGDRQYTVRFGGDRVRRSDVLSIHPADPQATYIGDLASGTNVPAAAYDCIVLTQVLPFIYEMHAAVRHVYAALRPGGVLLATLPSISQISRPEMELGGDFWRFTSASARRLFADAFGERHVSVDAFGNVLAACAFLYQLGSQELRAGELDGRHPDYEVIVGVRAVKG